MFEKKALAAVAFIASILVLSGLIMTIQHYRNRPVVEPGLSAITEVTAKNFKQEVMQSQIPVYVVFVVSGHGASEDQLKLVEKVAADYAGKVKFVKVDAKKEPGIAHANGVQGVPTSFILNLKAQAIIKAEGLMSEPDLRKFLDTGLNQPTQPDPNGNGGNDNDGNGNNDMPPAKDNPEGK